jgi:hypothetical protein
VLETEEKLFEEFMKAREEAAALAALCERYKMALEAASACSYSSDAEKIVEVALRP